MEADPCSTSYPLANVRPSHVSLRPCSARPILPLTPCPKTPPADAHLDGFERAEVSGADAAAGTRLRPCSEPSHSDLIALSDKRSFPRDAGRGDDRRGFSQRTVSQNSIAKLRPPGTVTSMSFERKAGCDWRLSAPRTNRTTPTIALTICHMKRPAEAGLFSFRTVPCPWLPSSHATGWNGRNGDERRSARVPSRRGRLSRPRSSPARPWPGA